MVCKITPVFEILSKKWNLHILKHISDNGKKRFNELLDEIQGINPRILSNRLKDLEDRNILTRKRFNETPPRCEYDLTDSGRELIMCFEYLDKWADKNKWFLK